MMLEISTDTRFDLAASGLRHGDGLFETIRVEGGRPRLLSRHLARLAAGLAFLEMPPLPPADDLIRHIRAFLDRSSDQGQAGSNPDRKSDAASEENEKLTGALRLIAADGRLTLLFQPLDLRPPTPVGMTVSQRVVRNRRNVLNAFKTVSYLENLLLVREAEAAGAFDAVAPNEIGELTDGGRTNLFVVQGGIALTPPVSSGCLPGVARGVLVGVGLAAEQALRPTDLTQAEAVFLTNALRGVIPVASLFLNPTTPAPHDLHSDHPLIRQASQVLAKTAEPGQ